MDELRVHCSKKVLQLLTSRQHYLEDVCRCTLRYK